MKMEVVSKNKIVPKKKSVVKKPAVKKTTTKAVTVTKKKEIAVQSESGALLKMAIDKDLDVDKLEKLIALKVQEEERQCKKDFDLHFNEMQRDFEPVSKGKNVFNKTGDKVLYKFAPLEDILKVYSPIISKHGFSYRWEEESIKEKEKRIHCIISGYGFEKTGFVDIPIQEGTTFTNSIQQRGVSTTYGKRYSFINAFGVIIGGEDDDASSLIEGDNEAYQEYRSLLEEAKTKEDLVSSWSIVWKSLANDTIGKRILMGTYNTMKDVLK